MTRVGGGRDEAGELVDVGGATDRLEAARSAELFGESDFVDADVALGERDRRDKNILVGRAKEMLRGDALLEADLEGVSPVDQDAGHQAALGVEVVRGYPTLDRDIGVRGATLGIRTLGHGQTADGGKEGGGGQPQIYPEGCE